MDEMPLIELNTRFKLGVSGDTIVILDIWVDEDGVTRVRINDNFTEKKTVTVNDIHRRLHQEGFEKKKSFSYEEREYR